MNNNYKVWLASYPRSGNTLLRTILWQCFGLRSSSVYPNDLGANRALEAFVGHVEREPTQEPAQQQQPALSSKDFVKTHKLITDDSPAIYVVRDGRAACVSLQQFYADTLTLEAVIEGQHQFGTWSAHVESWHPWDRPNTLLLKYEDLAHDLPKTLDRISEFIQQQPINRQLPDRDAIAAVDGRWVRRSTRWQDRFPAELLERFNELNHESLSRLGYL